MSYIKQSLAALALAGGVVAGSVAVSAAPMPGPGLQPVPSGFSDQQPTAEKAHWRRRGWNRGWRRGPSIYFGFGPRWGYRRHHWRRGYW